MVKALAFGLGVGAGIQAWRAFPPSLPVTADAAAVVFIVGLVCAYIGGRSRRGSGATATATATAIAESTATATQSINLVFPAGHGAGSVTGVRLPSEAAPWMVGAEDHRQLDVSELEGMDLTEFLEEQPEST